MPLRLTGPRCLHFISKIKAQILFSDEGEKLVHQNGELIRILLTSDLAEEYRLFQRPVPPEPDVKVCLHRFPLAWEETGKGLVQHWVSFYIELKVGTEPVKVHQYPMSLEAKRGIAPHIWRQLKLGVLKQTQFANFCLAFFLSCPLFSVFLFPCCPVSLSLFLFYYILFPTPQPSPLASFPLNALAIATFS